MYTSLVESESQGIGDDQILSQSYPKDQLRLKITLRLLVIHIPGVWKPEFWEHGVSRGA